MHHGKRVHCAASANWLETQFLPETHIAKGPRRMIVIATRAAKLDQQPSLLRRLPEGAAHFISHGNRFFRSDTHFAPFDSIYLSRRNSFRAPRAIILRLVRMRV